MDKRKTKIWMIVILGTIILTAGLAFVAQQTGLYKGAYHRAPPAQPATTYSATATPQATYSATATPQATYSATGPSAANYITSNSNATLNCSTIVIQSACNNASVCTWQSNTNTCAPIAPPPPPPPSSSQPDLVAELPSHSPINPTTESSISFTATIKNQGTASTEIGFRSKLYLDWGNNGTIDVPIVVTHDVPLAGNNGTTTATFTGVFSGVSVGNHSYRICADDGSLTPVVESNEDNNCTETQTFTVSAAASPAPGPPPPGPQPPPPPPSAAILNISASLPQNQTTTLNAGIQFVKAISMDLTKTGGDNATDKISGITLNLSGDFPKTKLKDEELWVKGDIEEKVTGATIAKNPTKDVLTITLPANYLLGANKKFILYVKAEVAEVDSARKFQYKVTGITTNPAAMTKIYSGGTEAAGSEFTVAQASQQLTCSQGKIVQGGACACPAGKNEFAGGITFYTPNICVPCTTAQLISSGGFYCPQDKPTPPPPPPPPPLGAPPPPPPPPPAAAATGLQACALQGKYAYTGPAKPGVRTPGMCIDCPTETYIKLGGKCEADKTTAGASITGAATTGAAATTTTATAAGAATTAAATTAPAQAGARGAAPSAPISSLQGSQRLVRAPERGNAGPGVAVYFGILAAIQGGLWLRKRFGK